MRILVLLSMAFAMLGCQYFKNTVTRYEKDVDMAQAVQHTDYWIGATYEVQQKIYIQDDPGYHYPAALNPYAHIRSHELYDNIYPDNQQGRITKAIARLDKGEQIQCVAFELQYDGPLGNELLVLMQKDAVEKPIIFRTTYISKIHTADNSPFGDKYPERFRIPCLDTRLLKEVKDGSSNEQ